MAIDIGDFDSYISLPEGSDASDYQWWWWSGLLWIIGDSLVDSEWIADLIKTDDIEHSYSGVVFSQCHSQYPQVWGETGHTPNWLGFFRW